MKCKNRLTTKACRLFRVTGTRSYQKELSRNFKKKQDWKSSSPVNKTVHVTHHNRLNNAEEAKRLRKDAHAISGIKLPSMPEQDIVRQINRAKSAEQIREIINQHKYTIEHASIFGKAMKKCNEFRYYPAVRFIMQSMIESDVEPSAIEFGVFFNSMAHSDSSKQCPKYLEVMVKKYGIQPTIPIFSALIKGCRKQKDYQLAERYWNMMKTKRKLQPDALVYCEMISVYSSAKKLEEATVLFNEYLKDVEHGHASMELPVLAAYLNGYSRAGDVEGMRKVVAMIKENGFEVNNIIIADVMRGYYAAIQPRNSYIAFTKWLESERKNKGEPVLNMSMIAMKQAALASMIKDDEEIKADFEKRYGVYKELEDSVVNQLDNYGVKANPVNYGHLLKGAISVYYDKDPMEIVKIFRNMVNDGCVGYVGKQHEANGKVRIVMDLHHFVLQSAQFVLRYVFGFELKNLMERVGEDELTIVVGRGKHRTDGKSPLREFVIKELQSWEPEIRCHPGYNDGSIVIKKEDLLPYLQNEKNYARQKFMQPSDDWCTEDPRRMNIKSDSDDDSGSGSDEEEEKENAITKTGSRKMKVVPVDGVWHGDELRKRATRKFIDELRDNLPEGQLFEIFDINGDHERYICKTPLYWNKFLLWDVTRKCDIEMNMKRVVYRLLEETECDYDE